MFNFSVAVILKFSCFLYDKFKQKHKKHQKLAINVLYTTKILHSDQLDDHEWNVKIVPKYKEPPPYRQVMENSDSNVIVV